MCTGLAPPPGFERPPAFRRDPPLTQYIAASFGKRPIFNPIDYDSIVTSGLPPIGYVTCWQEKEDVEAGIHAETMKSIREALKTKDARKKRMRELREKYLGPDANKKTCARDDSSEDDDDASEDDEDDRQSEYVNVHTHFSTVRIPNPKEYEF